MGQSIAVPRVALADTEQHDLELVVLQEFLPTGYRFSTTRDELVDGICLELRVLVSYDDGSTWSHIRTTTLAGGAGTNRNGTPSNESWIAGLWPPGGVPDRVKVTSCAIQACAFAPTLEVT